MAMSTGNINEAVSAVMLPESGVEETKAHSAPIIIVDSDDFNEYERKRKEIQNLDEIIRTRIGQIERAERRLLSLQQQLLALPSLESRLGSLPLSDVPAADVFRVDESASEPLSLSVSPPSSPRGAQWGHSSTSLHLSHSRSLSASNGGAWSHPTPIHAVPGSRSDQFTSPLGNSPPSLSVTPVASPSANKYLTRSNTFNIRSSNNTIGSETHAAPERSLFSNAPSSTSNNNTISFTLLKSFFGGNAEDKQAAVQFKIDTSLVHICERVPKLCTTDYEVFRANVGGWGCNVKIMQLGAKEAKDTRFSKRIKLLEAMPTHANIARYYFHEISEDGNICRIFTEWFHTNLTDVLETRLKAGRYFSVEEIEFVLMEVVKGIEFLHSYSILHRTISPNNIHVLLNDQGEVTRVAIANLDLAKVITDRVNAKGATMHDPRYCAPEVLTAKKTGAYSFPSDIWSLGLVAYSLLTLQKPWKDENSLNKLTETVTSGQRPTLEDLRLKQGAEEYAALVEIFKECTTLKPDDRPTVSIIKQALITKASIAEHRRASQLNIGFTYQPKREGSTFFEKFLVVGCPIGLKKPEQGKPAILYQYPAKESMPLTHQDVLLKFCMAQHRPALRIKRTNSMSNVNQKLFASRDMTEHSSSASIFTMMEGDELRYGICVYFEEPVDIVPSFMTTAQLLEQCKDDPSAIDVKRTSKSLNRFATPPSKRRAGIAPLPTSTGDESQVTPLSGRDLLIEPMKRRRHQRTASDGSVLLSSGEFAKQAAAAAAAAAADAIPSAPLPGGLGHVKFTNRCYMLFSKWPFFKLHFEVLWALIAQERLARITAPEKTKPASSSSSSSSPSSTSVSLSTSISTSSSTSSTSSTSSASFSTSSTSTVTATPSTAIERLTNNESVQKSGKLRSTSLASRLHSSRLPTSTIADVHIPDAIPESPVPAETEEDEAMKQSIPPSSSSLDVPPPTALALSSTPSNATSSTTSTAATPKRKTSNPKRVSISTTTVESHPNAIKADHFDTSHNHNNHHTDLESKKLAESEPEPTEENCIVLKMLGSYHRIPVPIEKHQTTLTLSNHPPILYTPGDVTEAVAEWCFPCMFRTLKVKTLIKLFTAVLLEEKIVMYSMDTGILTSCVTGLTAMLRPYAWQGTFLPVVPPSMMDVLESPIPFVAGIPSATPTLPAVDGVVVDLATDTMSGSRTQFPRLPHSDRIYDAFTAYATSVATTGHPANPCKSSPSDAEALTKLLAALTLWHTQLLEQLAAVPAVQLDFKWNNPKEVDAVVRALASSERDFYREFFETSHFSIVSDRLNTVICQIRSRKDHRKHVKRLEDIFTTD